MSKILAVVGGSNINNRYLVTEHLDNLVDRIGKKDLKIISFQGLGLPKIVSEYCKDFRIPLEVIPLDVGTYADYAVNKRSVDLVDNCSHLLVFWDGLDEEIKDIIQKAEDVGIVPTIVHYHMITKRNISLNCDYLFAEELGF